MTPRGAGFGLDSPLLLLRGYLASHPLPRSLPDGSDSSLVGVRTQNVSEARTPFPQTERQTLRRRGLLPDLAPSGGGGGGRESALEEAKGERQGIFAFCESWCVCGLLAFTLGSSVLLECLTCVHSVPTGSHSRGRPPRGRV